MRGLSIRQVAPTLAHLLGVRSPNPGAAKPIAAICEGREKVLSCKTLFDVLVEGGRHPAIVAVRDQSSDRIFRNRKMTYYSERYDPEVVKRTVAILQSGSHDVVVAYPGRHKSR